MPDWYLHQRGALLLLQGTVGMFLFAYPLQKRSRFAMRAILSFTLGAFIAWMAGTWLHLNSFRQYAPVLVYLLLILEACCIFQETPWTSLFAASSGYAAQDMAGSVKRLFKLLPRGAELAADPLGVLLADLICYGGVYLLLFALFRSFTRRRSENFDNKIKTAFSVGVLLLCIGMSRLTQDNPDRNLMAQFAECLYAVLCDALLLMLQFGVMERARLSGNVDELRLILQKQQAQYEAKKDSMELVNEKYHDLKAMLRGFRGQIPAEQMKHLEQEVNNYDFYVHTGNTALDVLLSEYRARCTAQNIQLTCYVGGTDLNFVEELDLYSLFSNILNNAVEAVSQLPPEQERFITLTARRENNIVTIHAENPCIGTVEFRDGLPQSQRDPDYHGFGMRSMERVAEKYGGSLIAKQSGDIFYLDIILFE